MSLPDPRSLYLPKWWWSRLPFYCYNNARGQGWGHLVDKHPGLFNLAWAMSGGAEPPQDYMPYAQRTAWVFSEAAHIPMAGKTMADWAFVLNVGDFAAKLKADRRGLERWKFHDSHINYPAILIAVSKAGKARA